MNTRCRYFFTIWAYHDSQRAGQVARSGRYALLPWPRCLARYVAGISRNHRHTAGARDMRVTSMYAEIFPTWQMIRSSGGFRCALDPASHSENRGFKDDAHREQCLYDYRYCNDYRSHRLFVKVAREARESKNHCGVPNRVNSKRTGIDFCTSHVRLPTQLA